MQITANKEKVNYIPNYTIINIHTYIYMYVWMYIQTPKEIETYPTLFIVYLLYLLYNFGSCP